MMRVRTAVGDVTLELDFEKSLSDNVREQCAQVRAGHTQHATHQTRQHAARDCDAACDSDTLHAA
jgi:hypothetical protein